jgi:hypothetical protein
MPALLALDKDKHSWRKYFRPPNGVLRQRKHSDHLEPMGGSAYQRTERCARVSSPKSLPHSDLPQFFLSPLPAPKTTPRCCPSNFNLSLSCCSSPCCNGEYKKSNAPGGARETMQTRRLRKTAGEYQPRVFIHVYSPILFKT